MRPNELTGELLARITNTMVIIKESYATYENKVAAPAHHDTSRGYLEATTTKWRNDSISNMMQFFKMKLGKPCQEISAKWSRKMTKTP
jgi:hypothetical protein